MPLGTRYFRYLAPFYPLAFERFDLSAYDVIVSSTTAWAKGVRFRSDAVHVCYINTVSRFAFDYERYVNGFALGPLVRPIVGRLVAWDQVAATRPTAFVANSENVAARIRAYYGRDAFVVPCPVDVDRFTPGPGDGDYFLIASRLLPYKRIDRAIAAAQSARVRLLVAGTGPAEKALRGLAAGTTTTLLGYVDDARLNALIGAARAVILPGEEDFGLVPLEAAAAGTPSIALRAGGARETIIDGVTGEFFGEPAPESLASVLSRFDRARYDAAVLRRHAESFAPDRFIARLRAIIDAVRDGVRPPGPA